MDKEKEKEQESVAKPNVLVQIINLDGDMNPMDGEDTS